MMPSSMRDQVDDYLSMRSELGFDVESQRWLLRDFTRYAERVDHRGPVSIDLAVGWALSSCPGDPARAERRLGAVRQLARHRAVFEPKTVSFLTSMNPLGGRFSHRHEPTAEAVFSRP